MQGSAVLNMCAIKSFGVSVLGLDLAIQAVTAGFDYDIMKSHPAQLIEIL